MANRKSTSKFKAILKSLGFSVKPGESRAVAALVSAESITSTSITSPTSGPIIRPSSASPRDTGIGVLEVARPALRLGASIASGIPGAGAPVKAAINLLLIVLDGFDQSAQNRVHIRDLRDRVRRLSDILEAGASYNPRMDIFIQSFQVVGIGVSLMPSLRQLANTEKKLLEAQNMSKFRYEKVSEVIQACNNDKSAFDVGRATNTLIRDRPFLDNVLDGSYGK
ncbi:hypothetical protein H0H92_000601 [Tricholoma furcatifolium]|nr:hypothetical protein H0H92_000601 [Tricholoma furcatifolium]